MAEGFREKGEPMQPRSSDPRQWIEECEAAFRRQMVGVCDRILQIRHIKMIGLVGPTCSGKTTAANLLIRRLSAYGKRVHLVSVDDFYYNREQLHRQAQEEGRATPDYDSIRTIDLEELARFVSELSDGTLCRCPTYDFKTGMRGEYRSFPCGEEDLFLFEGIQVMYPEIRTLLQTLPSVGVYIVPSTSLEVAGERFEPNEIRLLRRLVRDYNFRDTAPEHTFRMWSSVRENEERSIFPYVGECSYTLDSTMPYELSVLKPFLCEILKELPAGSVYMPLAEEILKKIEPIREIDARLLPEDSLYREFV